MKRFKIEFTYITYAESDDCSDAIDVAVNEIQNLRYGEITENMEISEISGEGAPEE